MASPLALSGLGSSYLNLFHYGWCRVSSGPGYCHAGIVREGKPGCFNSLNFQLCIERFVDSTTQELCTFSFNINLTVLLNLTVGGHFLLPTLCYRKEAFWNSDMAYTTGTSSMPIPAYCYIGAELAATQV